MGRSAIEALARRDRIVVAAGLAVLTVLGWLYIWSLAAGMAGMEPGPSGGMGGMAMPALRPWGPADFALMFAMWAVMMVAMMTPSAAPMILLYAAVARKARTADAAIARTGSFAAGYLAVWTGFSAIATLAQWGLERAALLSPMMVGTSTALGGALLVAAGLYQLTPLKHTCLDHCRSPVHFLAVHWRPGASGAFRMGVAHGAFCVGCCWALMALLFVGGVMNIAWIAILAGLVLAEKLLPRGALLARLTGAALIAAGTWMPAAG